MVKNRAMHSSRFLSILFALFFIPSAQANIVGSDFNNFNPTSNGLDFVTVHSSDTLKPGEFNLGTFLTYSTNSLPYFVVNGANTNQKFSEPNDAVLGSDLHFGLGILEWWDIGLSAFNVLDQDVGSSTALATYLNTGLSDVRFNTKFRFYRDDQVGLAFVLSVDDDRISNNPYSGVNPGLTFNGEFAFDLKFSEHWRWGVNTGYRLRNSGQAIAGTAVTPVSDQILYSSAIAYDFYKIDSNLMFEIFGSSPTVRDSTPTDREISNLQALLGWKWRVNEKLDLHIGGGGELYHGFGSPDFMAYAGVNWRPGNLWNAVKDTDKDGVPDNADACPNTKPELTGQVDATGCSDDDRDGVANNLDMCPDTKTEQRGFVNDKGCYINDLDGDGVSNDKDRCPQTPPKTKVNDLGCMETRMKEIRLEDFNFVSGSAVLTPGSMIVLRGAVEKLNALEPNIALLIVEGHTDSRGNDSSNLELSDRRASVVRAYLASKLKTLRPEQVESKGYGESRPIDSNKSKKGRSRNRRVELRVILRE